MAAVVHGGSANSTSNNQPSYATGSFTPAANDLLVAFICVTGGSVSSVTDSLGGTWYLADSRTKNSSADNIYQYVREALVSNTAMTVTANITGSTSTGCIILVGRVSGMTRTGALAVRQAIGASNQAGGGTPNVPFGTACLTANPTIVACFNAANPATLTPPTNWTERLDTGYGSPATGGEYASRDSGHTGTTVTWGGTSASAFGTTGVELDTSDAPIPDDDPGRSPHRQQEVPANDWSVWS